MNEFEAMEQAALDNYMEESIANDIFRLLIPIPFDQLPTLGEWLD